MAIEQARQLVREDSTDPVLRAAAIGMLHREKYDRPRQQRLGIIGRPAGSAQSSDPSIVRGRGDAARVAARGSPAAVIDLGQAFTSTEAGRAGRAAHSTAMGRRAARRDREQTNRCGRNRCHAPGTIAGAQ